MAAKTKPAAQSADKTVRFAFVKETPGALRFEEVDTDGKLVLMDKARIGPLYFRKARFGELSADWASEGKPPALVVITIACADK
jgi:hypothetical protein